MAKEIKEEINQGKTIAGVLIRYSILVILGILNLSIFYILFTPLTVYPVYFFFKIFFENALLEGTSIYFKTFTLHIVPSCIAGSAYYLLTILNFSVKMKFTKRILSLLFSYIVFLIMNILRIFLFAVFYIKVFSFYILAHFIFWYFLSTAMVFLIWFLTIKAFDIQEIPLYSDFKRIRSMSKHK